MWQVRPAAVADMAAIEVLVAAEAESYISPEIAVDSLVYTPEEFRAMIEEGNPFVEQALKDGKKVRWLAMAHNGQHRMWREYGSRPPNDGPGH